MASIIECLLAKAALGKVSASSVERIKRHVEGLQEATKQSAEVLDELASAKKAFEDGTFALSQKQRNIVANMQRQEAAIGTMRAATEGGSTPMNSFKGLFYNVQRTANSYKAGVTERVMHPMQTYIKEAQEHYHARMFEVRSSLGRSEITGSMDATLNRETGMELFNLERGLKAGKGSAEAIDNAAKLFETSKFGSKEYKRLGGLMNIEHDNIMGLRVSPEILRRLSVLDESGTFDSKFVAEMMQWGVDVDHINRTLRTNLRTDADLKAFLEGSYKAMLSGGPIDKTGALVPKELQGLATANNLHRILRFTSPESTMAFIEKYGAGNMDEHLKAYSVMRGTEDGVHEGFGPSPHATKAAILEHIKQTAPEAHAEASALFDRYASHLGIFNSAQSLVDEQLNLVSASAKNWFRAAVLGSIGTWQATIDMWNLPRMSNKFKGLSTIKNIEANYKELFKGRALSVDEAKMLAKRGFLLEAEMQRMEDSLLSAADQGRTNSAAAYTSAGADAAVQRITGGTRAIGATTSGSKKFLIGELSDIVESGSLSSKGEDMGNYLKSLGFTQDILDFIKANALDETYHYENKFLAINKQRLIDIDSEAGRNASRALTRVLMDQEQSINPMAPGGFAAAAAAGRRAGTVSRIGTDSVTALTSYLSGVTSNMIQMAAEMPSKSGRMRVYSTFLIGSVIGAYESSVINEILRGRDVPPLSAELLGKVVGRAFGPVGDALVSGGDSSKGGILQSFLPLGKFFTDIGGNAIALGKDVVTGDADKIPAHAVKLLSRMMPGQTAPVFATLWKHYIEEQLLLMTDPDAMKKMDNREKQREGKMGSESWWKPGELTPSRAPDLSKLATLHIQEDKGQ